MLRSKTTKIKTKQKGQTKKQQQQNKKNRELKSYDTSIFLLQRARNENRSNGKQQDKNKYLQQQINPKIEDHLTKWPEYVE